MFMWVISFMVHAIIYMISLLFYNLIELQFLQIIFDIVTINITIA